MKKKTLLYILLDSVFLVVFNTVFFVAGGTEHPVSVWLSYAFIHIAYLLMLVTPMLVRKGSSAAVFGFSLYSISSVYFFIEFIVGLIFIFVRSESYKAALIVQVILAGIYAAMLISNMIANENTAESIEKHEKEVAYIKNASSKVRLLVDKLPDRKANREIERVYDLLHSSPTQSDASVKSLEAEILNKVYELECAVDDGSSENAIAVSKMIVSLVEERNRKIRN